jgi:hypothetical protein
MSNILKFLNKHFKRFYLIFPLFIGNTDGIIVVTVLLLILYLHSNTKILKNVKNKFINIDNNKNNNNDNYNNNNDNDTNHNDDDSNHNNHGNHNNKNHNDNSESFDLLNEIKNLEKNILDIKVNSTTDNLSKENIDLKKNINENIVSKKSKSFKDNLEFTPYANNRREIKKNYTEKPEKHDFSVNVNSSVCSIPIFNLRTYKEIDFYFNFIIHNYDSKKIHNLILCKDIHKWMNNSSLSDQDISNELVPVYLSLKNNDKVDVYEYLKIFIHNGEDGKIAFIQKGYDYLVIEKYINELVDKEIIDDLLDGKMYTSYNLYSNDGVNDFLNKFLSLVLISENSIGDDVKLDIENYYENKSSYEYFFNTVNADSSIFNTTI